jgi:hypothetical protein
MRPGGSIFRRRLATCVVAVSAMAFIPVSVSNAGSPNRTLAREGDLGSGPGIPYSARTGSVTTGTSIDWSDVPKTYWDHAAIDYVGATHAWMRDYPAASDGTYPFHPSWIETRKYLARAAVRAFGSGQTVDPSITFDDMSASAPFYPFANIAVKLGWMNPIGSNFEPNQPVTMSLVHHVLVYAMGLRSVAQGIDAIHTAGGYTFSVPPNFGSIELGMQLGFRYDHANPALDVLPDSPMPRAEVAFSLYRAKTAPSWLISWVSRLGSIKLPSMGATRRAVVQFAIRYVGYPYIWAGEWYRKTPPSYPFGYQPMGGFDCSGLAWWVMKRTGDGWDNAPPRPYAGWPLYARTADGMALKGHIGYKRLVTGDLMFFDGNGDGVVDHVDIYLGNGWSVDSSNGYGGVSILDVASGWYHDHFVWGRRLIPLPQTSPSPSPSPTG